MKLTARFAALASPPLPSSRPPLPPTPRASPPPPRPTAYVGDTCIDQPVNYSVNLPADAKDWFLQIKPVYPNGAEGVSSYVGTIKGPR